MEQSLRDEVIYLHSLWHQGPPSSSSTRTSHPLLPSTSSSRFKKQSEYPKPKKPKSITPKPPPLHHQPDSGVEWPCPPLIPNPSPAAHSAWPDFPKPETQLPPSPRRLARFLANQVQFKALKAVTQFFNSMDTDDDDEDGDFMDDPQEDAANQGSQDSASRFFARLFQEEGDLRELYLKSFVDGDFSCLVCGGVGKSKRFKDCMALVQHTITIAKTKKRKEHKAYGRVVCKVLGWDIDNLSKIVSLISEKRNALVSKSCEGESSPLPNSDNGNKDTQSNIVDNVDSVNGNNDEEVRGKKCNDNEQLPDDGEATASKGLPFVSDPNGRGEDPDKEAAELVQNTEHMHNSMENSNDGDKEMAISVGDKVELGKDSNEEKECSFGKKQLFDNGVSEIGAEDVKTGIAAETEGNMESSVQREPEEE